VSLQDDGDEERLLRTVLHQNAESILIARQRAERDLELAKQALEIRTAQLATSLALTQATLESTADGIVATDDTGRITGFNEKVVDMWAVPRDVVEKGESRGLFDAMSRQMPDAERFAAEVNALLDNAPPESFDILELADGRVFERYTRAQKIADRVIGRVWSFRDITERAKAVADLRNAKAQAEAANRAKSAFLAMMSHELRTPLNAIAGYAELLQMGIHGPVAPDQAQALARIQASQRHLLGLIDGVLTHAKLETGHAHYDLITINAIDAISRAEALIAPQAWTNGVSLTPMSCVDDVLVRADAEKLQQILLNLLSNAVKFTQRGGQIAMACVVVDADVHIEIRDTGIGIPDDMLDRIFEPFVQVRSELTRPVEGTGLGLAISRALARGMGGELTARSEMGHGSTFTLILPHA
jgi:signal transduction histidine kinase